MLTYHRGEWKEDTAVSEDYNITNDELITYGNFEIVGCLAFGIDYYFYVTAWRLLEHEKDAKPYSFFVQLEHGEGFECVLVADYPSLLMLLKEVNPIIQAIIERQKFEMFEEEHKWKALRAKEEYGSAIKCGH